ncbi:hypothetical protein FOZ62_018877, partial [Perkinsus olseni]
MLSGPPSVRQISQAISSHDEGAIGMARHHDLKSVQQLLIHKVHDSADGEQGNRAIVEPLTPHCQSQAIRLSGRDCSRHWRVWREHPRKAASIGYIPRPSMYGLETGSNEFDITTGSRLIAGGGTHCDPKWL